MSTALAPQPAQVDQGVLIDRIRNRSLSVNARVYAVGDFMKLNKEAMFAALPKHITADRLIRVALNCIRRTPKLLDCTPESLFGAIIEASALGLEPNGILGHAYLVPYKTECTLIPGYKGLIDLCRRSGTISTLSAEVVHQGDQFAYQLGDDPFVRHVPNDADPERHKKPITYVYVVVKLRDGGIQRKVWSANKVNAHKEQYSQGWRWAEKGDKAKGGGKKDSPWHVNWPEMAKKTVIRDLINRGEIPTSVEVQQLAAREELYESERMRTFDIRPGISLGDLDTALTGNGGLDSAPVDDAGDEPPADAHAGDYAEDAGSVPDPNGFDLDAYRAALAACETEEAIDAVHIEWSNRTPTEELGRVVDELATESKGRFRKPGKTKQSTLQGA